MGLVNGEEQGQPQKSEEQQENNVDEGERLWLDLYHKKELDSCRRWRNLGVLKICG